MRPVWTFSVFSLQSYSCFRERSFFIRWGGGEGEQTADQVSVDFINLWSSHTTGLLFSQRGGSCGSGTPSPEIWTLSEKTAVSGGKTKKKLPKFFLRLWDTHKKYILQKNWVKTAIPALSSGQSNLQTSIWGCHRQLDDQHRSPNTNNKDHLVGRLTRYRAATAAKNCIYKSGKVKSDG